jgi:ketosteroid isomerase-like protein
MKTAVLAGVLLAGSISASAAMAANAQLEAPIHQFIDAFDKGDMKTAAAAFLPSITIIDEVPPHYWQGPGAFAAWGADLQKDSKAAGLSDEKVTLGKVTDEIESGATAYVVIEATFSYRQKGVAMREPAHMSYAMNKTAAGWKIAGWAWSGTPPKPVK